jgi:hypothetical protein
MQPCPCPEEVHRYLGETIGFWIQTVALIASAIGAFLLIRDTRKGIERQITANHDAIDSQIRANQLAVDAQITANLNAVDAQIKANQASSDSQIKANAAALETQIKTSQEGVEKQVWAASKGQERRATIELMLSQNSDPELKKATNFIKERHRTGETNLAVYIDNRKGEEYLMLVYLLNTYEFTAAAIKENALDEDLLKRMQYTVILKNWKVLEPFVMVLRDKDKHDTLFQEIQMMAERWKLHPLQKEI